MGKENVEDIGVSDGLIVASYLTDERVPDGNTTPDLMKKAGSGNTQVIRHMIKLVYIKEPLIEAQPI